MQFSALLEGSWARESSLLLSQFLEAGAGFHKDKIVWVTTRGGSLFLIVFKDISMGSGWVGRGVSSLGKDVEGGLSFVQAQDSPTSQLLLSQASSCPDLATSTSTVPVVLSPWVSGSS